MDPTDAGPSGGRFETFDANDRFVVVRDEEGYGVWRLEDLGQGDPIERFADDDTGYQLAADMWHALTREDRRRRNPWLSLLKWIVIVSSILWAGAKIISTSIFYMNQFEMFRGGSRDLSLSGFYEVMEIISTVGYSFTVSATAIYLVLWLEGRRDR